jgi:hypothetical protein
VSTLWGEGADDLEDFANVQHDLVSGPVLVSLFRDLFTDGQVEASPDEGEMTITSVAGMDFDPISAADVNALRLKAELGWPKHLVSVQLALDTLGVTKDELKRGIQEERAEDLNPIAVFDASTEFLQIWVEVIEKAKWRTVLAGAALELAEEATQ